MKQGSIKDELTGQEHIYYDLEEEDHVLADLLRSVTTRSDVKPVTHRWRYLIGRDPGQGRGTEATVVMEVDQKTGAMTVVRVLHGVPEGYTAWDGTWRKWIYTDDERPLDEPVGCYDCGRAYGTMGDCVVPHDVWERINPTCHPGAGILCANCIMDRLAVLDSPEVIATLWPAVLEKEQA